MPMGQITWFDPVSARAMIRWTLCYQGPSGMPVSESRLLEVMRAPTETVAQPLRQGVYPD